MKTQPSSTNSRGFTFAELLVTIVVLAMLGGLCLAGVSAGDQSARGVCSGNLKQFSRAMLMYAADNREQFPDANQQWSWDMPPVLKGAMTNYGVRWQQLYCPGTASRFTESDNWGLYNFSSFAVIGYAMTLPGSNLHSTNWNSTTIPRVAIPVGLPVGTLSERVFLADATLCQGVARENNRSLYNYTNIPSGFSKPHMSPHLDGRLPDGGNVAMLDGHVQWRPFQSMQPRHTSGGPTFWW